MRNGAVKNFHKKIVKHLQMMNDNIRKDDLWLGRFEVREVQQFYSRFEDGSGYQAWYILEVTDKKTGKTARKMFDTHFGVRTNDEEDRDLDHNNMISLRFFGSKLWSFVNDFIMEDVKVWEENPQPHKSNAINYCPKVRKPKYVIPNGILSNI